MLIKPFLGKKRENDNELENLIPFLKFLSQVIWVSQKILVVKLIYRNIKRDRYTHINQMAFLIPLAHFLPFLYSVKLFSH